MNGENEAIPGDFRATGESASLPKIPEIRWSNGTRMTSVSCRCRG